MTRSEESDETFDLIDEILTAATDKSARGKPQFYANYPKSARCGNVEISITEPLGSALMNLHREVAQAVINDNAFGGADARAALQDKRQELEVAYGDCFRQGGLHHTERQCKALAGNFIATAKEVVSQVVAGQSR